ncbi:DNA packaging tegument protein UL25 [Testudinid alphaherpesvirus 3]|uniref:DNA packaging tegument protein UL25 n=1 Tax=Testudinid alphaherpesvirus 3 TaxID=2560801 RepID=A0A0K1R183_9ALPH|nr:DNA packaging tegument protein UL25 [Testudinid alphaherpesvirus 3]AIU39270.1 DNA packaging tegument protein UL25 [Testudinid alphaherpesvirus 3]AKV40697.1 UL25 virion packaging protein [Testudinid alphaherpesvirus 3]
MFAQAHLASWLPSAYGQEMGMAEVFPGHHRNLLRPTDYPMYRGMRNLTDRHGKMRSVRELDRLRIKQTAARVALDRLQADVRVIPEEAEPILEELEQDAEAAIDILDRIEYDLSRMVDRQEKADVLPPSQGLSPIPSAQQKSYPVARESRRVQVVKNDMPFTFEKTLSLDLIQTVYGADTTPKFGHWYRRLQSSVLTTSPRLTRSLNTQDNLRMSKKFMQTVLEVIGSITQLYVGKFKHTGLEVGLLCLYMYHEKLTGKTTRTNIHEIIRHANTYLTEFENELETNSRISYEFGAVSSDDGGTAFSSPSGGRYKRGVLSNHSVYTLLVAKGIIPVSKHELGTREIQPDPEYERLSDSLASAADVIFPNRSPLRVSKDETIIRAAIDSICYLLLLRRLSYNTNVYDNRNKMLILSNFVSSVDDDQLTRGTSEIDAKAINSQYNNFNFLLEEYVLPVYKSNPGVEIANLFPGLVLLCLTVSKNTNRKQAIPTGLEYQELLTFLVPVLENKQRAPVDVVIGHEALMLECEIGLGKCLGRPRLRNSLFSGKTLGQFDVKTDYDLLYFVCLGFIPTVTII